MHLTRLHPSGLAAADGGSLMLILTGAQGTLPPAQRQAFIAHLRRLHASLPAGERESASELLDFIKLAERGAGAP
ncbi:hypothetical protein EII20_01695 [Comamonadaceae bacterium OH2545_COT-014]|nr:hypothetical protein EII20_01695 [Comamonadaceae bacterium OH2545_COT-014]